MLWKDIGIERGSNLQGKGYGGGSILSRNPAVQCTLYQCTLSVRGTVLWKEEGLSEQHAPMVNSATFFNLKIATKYLHKRRTSLHTNSLPFWRKNLLKITEQIYDSSVSMTPLSLFPWCYSHCRYFLPLQIYWINKIVHDCTIKYFSIFVRGPDRLESWRKNED